MTPRAKKPVIGAGAEDCFAVRIAAPPVDGAANEALIAFIAKSFGVPRRAVALISGDTARHKRLSIAGDTATLASIAANLYGIAHERTDH